MVRRERRAMFQAVVRGEVAVARGRRRRRRREEEKGKEKGSLELEFECNRRCVKIC